MPRVVIIFTGGTIAMRASAGGSVPAMRGAELLASVPGLERIAEIEPIDWGLIPASHLSFAQVLEIGRLLAEQLARPEIDGAVVVQGTDVIEETAFAWDLLPLPPKPVVVVGAMLTAADIGYDGPDNVRNAVAAAVDSRLGDQGVVVAMGGELHAADDVQKSHTHDLATFRSPNAGRLGALSNSHVTLERSRLPPARLPAIPAAAALPIPTLTVVLDAAPEPIPEDVAGVVVAAAGGGNTPVAYLERATSLIERGIPVVLTTRCPSGQPKPGYGFPGGSTQWWEAGAIFSGTLGPLKSRVLLALGIGAGLATPELAALCGPSGGGRIAAPDPDQPVRR